MKNISYNIYKVCVYILTRIIRGFLWIDRRLIKAYLRIETPLYKLWWRLHSEKMQRKLNQEYFNRYVANSL